MLGGGGGVCPLGPLPPRPAAPSTASRDHASLCPTCWLQSSKEVHRDANAAFEKFLQESQKRQMFFDNCDYTLYDPFEKRCGAVVWGIHPACTLLPAKCVCAARGGLVNDVPMVLCDLCVCRSHARVVVGKLDDPVKKTQAKLERERALLSPAKRGQCTRT